MTNGSRTLDDRGTSWSSSSWRSPSCSSAIGAQQWGWDFDKLATLFLIMGLVSGIIGGLGVSGTADALVAGARDMTFSALIVGLARGIFVVLDEGHIVDSLVHALVTPLEGLPVTLAALGMFFAQALIHIPVPSTSGQAVLTMPILAPGVRPHRAVTTGDRARLPARQRHLRPPLPDQRPLLALLAISGVRFDEWFKWALAALPDPRGVRLRGGGGGDRDRLALTREGRWTGGHFVASGAAAARGITARRPAGRRRRRRRRHATPVFEFEEVTIAAAAGGHGVRAGHLGRASPSSTSTASPRSITPAPRSTRSSSSTPRPLADAARLDSERKAGKSRGPLHGVPILIKDNIDTGDRMRTSAGSLALADMPAPADAFVVQRLRAAGAIILGKTNCSEWANFRSSHSTSGWSGRGGQTRNPYALDRNPCGSSSGTGAAISANLAMVGVGTETDGSVVCPSTANGLVGLKPTVGLVSRTGIIPISASQDTAGPMTRTVQRRRASCSTP